MVLNEAYRYQQFLDRLISMACITLTSKNVVTTTKEIHKKSAVDATYSDEEIVQPKSLDEGVTVEDIVGFTMELLDEKSKITDAIAKALRESDIDISSEINKNKARQSVVNALLSMARIKPSTASRRGNGYRFNNDGEQKLFYYDVDEITTIDFDRNKVRHLYQKLAREADAVSTSIDVANATVRVEYAPKYEVNDNFDDCLEWYIENK